MPCDGPLFAEALIGHRDGIVGSWRTPEDVTLDFDTQAFQDLDDYRQLWRWEPWVRATAIDFELLSNLRFWIGNGPDGPYAQLAHRVSTGGDVNIVSLSRPKKEVFEAQAEWLDFYSDLRDDRMAEILCQLGPQHAFWSMLIYLQPSRTPKTIELLDTAVRFAIFTEIRFKHAIAAPRAIEYSSQIQPMIQTPGHGSLPSGHSTQAFIIAVVLRALFKQPPTSVYSQQVMRQAYRVAMNRTVAGVHFPVDSIAGHVLGTSLGEYFVTRCTRKIKADQRYTRSNGQITPRAFKGTLVPQTNTPDFDYHEPLSDDDVVAYAIAQGNPTPTPANLNAVRAQFPYLDWTPASASTTVDGSDILAWLWNQAESEWNGNCLANTKYP